MQNFESKSMKIRRDTNCFQQLIDLYVKPAFQSKSNSSESISHKCRDDLFDLLKIFFKFQRIIMILCTVYFLQTLECSTQYVTKFNLCDWTMLWFRSEWEWERNYDALWNEDDRYIQYSTHLHHRNIICRQTAEITVNWSVGTVYASRCLFHGRSSCIVCMMCKQDK